MFLFATMAISLFLDCVAAEFFMLGIAHEIFAIFGFKKGDKWPKYMVIGITFTVILAFAMTPICHTASILFMGIYSGITGQAANVLGYMLVGIPVGFVIWFLMLLWFRFVVKPDISHFDKIDFAAIEAMRPGAMDKKEKLVGAVSILVLILWIIPGFLSFLAPTSSVFLFMDNLTATAPLFIAIVFLAIVRIEGKPVLDLHAAMKKVDWLSIVFLAGILMIATAMGEATTGIPDFIAKNIIPLAEGKSPYAVIALFAVLSCAITNIANNIPVGLSLIHI